MNEPDDKTRQLSAYLDGELPDDEASRLRAAIESDPQLATELQRLQAVRRLIGNLPRQRAGGDFAASVVRRAEQAGLLRARGGRWRRWAGYLAAAAVFLVVAGVSALIIFTSRPGPGDGRQVAMDYANQEPPQLAAGREAEPPLGASAEGLDAAGAVNKLEAEITAAEPVAATAREEAPGPRRPVASADEPPAWNEVIYADDLAATQRRVEHAFASNSIALLGDRRSGRTARYNPAARTTEAYSVRRVRTNQVMYTVIATPSQVAQLAIDLAAIRGGEGTGQAGADRPAERVALRSLVRRRPPFAEEDGKLAAAPSALRDGKPETADADRPAVGRCLVPGPLEQRGLAYSKAPVPPEPSAGVATMPAADRSTTDALRRHAPRTQPVRFVTMQITLNQAAAATDTAPATSTPPGAPTD